MSHVYQNIDFNLSRTYKGSRDYLHPDIKPDNNLKIQKPQFSFCHHRAQKHGEYKSCGFCKGFSLFSASINCVCSCLNKDLLKKQGELNYKYSRTYSKPNLVKLRVPNRKSYSKHRTYIRPKPYDRPFLSTMNNIPPPYKHDKLGVLYGTSYLVHPNISLENYPFTNRNRISTKSQPPIIHSNFGLHYPVANFNHPPNDQTFNSLPRHITKSNVGGNVASRPSVKRSNSLVVRKKPSCNAVSKNSRLQALGNKFPLSAAESDRFNFTSHAQLQRQNFTNESRDSDQSDYENYECIYPLEQTPGPNVTEVACSSNSTQTNNGEKSTNEIKENTASTTSTLKSKLKKKKMKLRRFTVNVLPSALFKDSSRECAPSTNVSERMPVSPEHEYENISPIKEQKGLVEPQRNSKGQTCVESVPAAAVPVPAPRTIFSSLKSSSKTNGAFWTPRTYRKQETARPSNYSSDDEFARTPRRQNRINSNNENEGMKSIVNVSLSNGGSFRQTSRPEVKVSHVTKLTTSHQCADFSVLSPGKSLDEVFYGTSHDIGDFSDKQYFTPSKLSRDCPHYENIPWITTPLKETISKTYTKANKGEYFDTSTRCSYPGSCSRLGSIPMVDNPCYSPVKFPSAMEILHEIPSSKAPGMFRPPMVSKPPEIKSGSGCVEPNLSITDKDNSSAKDIISTTISPKNRITCTPTNDGTPTGGSDCDSLTPTNRSVCTPSSGTEKSTPSIGSIWSDTSTNTVIRRTDSVNRSNSFQLGDLSSSKAKRSLFGAYYHNKLPNNPDEDVHLLMNLTTTELDDTSSCSRQDIDVIDTSVPNKFFDRLHRSSFKQKICSTLYPSPSKWYSTWHVPKRYSSLRYPKKTDSTSLNKEANSYKADSVSLKSLDEEFDQVRYTIFMFF